MLKTQELQINIGPQHPSTHGVFRLVVTVDGEKIVELFEMASGARMMCTYFRFGGVWRDLPPDFMPLLNDLMKGLPTFFDEFERLLRQSEILLLRSEGVGILPKELAAAYSVTGPVLRASGIPYDIRKAEPYSVYDELDFDVPIGSVGDVYDRFLIRIEEMRQSYKIVQQV